jgi:putative ABC transport system permease protein
MNVYYLARQNVKRKPFRSLVMVISICFLVALTIFAISFITNVNKSLEKTSNRLGADIIVVPSGARTIAEEFLLESKKKSFYMDMEAVEKIRSLEEVEKVTYQIYLKTVPGVCCDIQEAQVVVFDPESDFIVRPWLEESGIELNKGEYIVGHGSYEDLRFGLLEAQTIFGKEFKTGGVLEETGTGMDYSIFIGLEDFEEILKESQPVEPGKISVIFVRLKEGYKSHLVGRKIDGLFPEVDAIPRGEIGEDIKGDLMDINKIFTISIFYSAVFSIFLAWAIFSAIVNERRREIGLMRAMGAKRLHIFKLFISEAAFIGGAGGVLGVVLGNYIVNRMAEDFRLLENLSQALDTNTRIMISIFGFLGGIFVCVFGAFFPVIRVGGIEPLEAIKGE